MIFRIFPKTYVVGKKKGVVLSTSLMGETAHQFLFHTKRIPIALKRAVGIAPKKGTPTGNPYVW